MRSRSLEVCYFSTQPHIPVSPAKQCQSLHSLLVLQAFCPIKPSQGTIDQHGKAVVKIYLLDLLVLFNGSLGNRDDKIVHRNLISKFCFKDAKIRPFLLKTLISGLPLIHN